MLWLWFLFLLWTVIVGIFLVLFAPYAVRYVVAFVRIQFLKIGYGVIISCLELQRRSRLVAYRWQRWRAYRNSRRMMRRAALDIARHYQENIKQIYRSR